MAALGVHAASQLYLRSDGDALLRQLPAEALPGLRYYETAGTTAAFTPYAPLHGAALKGQQFYHVAVTDWSLFIMQRGGGEGSVLLEVPWLGIQDLECEECDNVEVLNMKGAPYKCDQIRLYPKVDTSKLTLAQTQELQTEADKINSGQIIVDLIPLSERWYASGHFPVPKPAPVPRPKDKPYTEGAVHTLPQGYGRYEQAQGSAWYGQGGSSGSPQSQGQGRRMTAAPHPATVQSAAAQTQHGASSGLEHVGAYGAGYVRSEAGPHMGAYGGRYAHAEAGPLNQGLMQRGTLLSEQMATGSGNGQWQGQQMTGGSQRGQWQGQLLTSQQGSPLQPTPQQEQHHHHQQQQQQQQQQLTTMQQQPNHPSSWWTQPPLDLQAGASGAPSGRAWAIGESTESLAEPSVQGGAAWPQPSAPLALHGQGSPAQPGWQGDALAAPGGGYGGYGSGYGGYAPRQPQTQPQLGTQQLDWMAWQQQVQQSAGGASPEPLQFSGLAQPQQSSPAGASSPGLYFDPAQVQGQAGLGSSPVRMGGPGYGGMPEGLSPGGGVERQWAPEMNQQQQYRWNPATAGVWGQGQGQGQAGGAYPAPEGLTWVEEQSLRWQQQQGQQQGGQQQGQQAAPMAGSSTAAHNYVQRWPVPEPPLGPLGVHTSTSISNDSAYVVAYNPETPSLPSLPNAQASRLSWAEQQGLLWRERRALAQAHQDHQDRLRYRAFEGRGGSSGMGPGGYILAHKPRAEGLAVRPDLPALVPQAPYYGFPGVGAGQAGQGQGQQPQQLSQQQLLWQRQQQLLLQQEAERQRLLQEQQQVREREARERRLRQQVEFSWVDGPYTPMHLRQAMPPVVPQPGRQEAWRSGDDDSPLLSVESNLEMLPGYLLQLVSIERRSALAFHIRRAWIGAHLRLGMLASGKTGLPTWYFPPPSPFLLHASRAALQKACAPVKQAVRAGGGRVQLQVAAEQPLQHMQYLAYFSHKIVVVPWQQTKTRDSMDDGGPWGVWSLFPPVWPQLQPWPMGPVSGAAPLHADARAAVNPSSVQSPEAIAAQGLRLSWTLPSKSDSPVKRAPKIPPNSILRSPEAEREASDSPASPSTSALMGPQPLREVWEAWEANDGPFKRGGSLLDDLDADLLREISLETGASDPARAHVATARLFTSVPALLFILQRLYAWGAICALYGRSKGDGSSEADPHFAASASAASAGSGRPAPSAYVHWVLTKNRRTGTAASREAVDVLTGAAKSADEVTYDFFRDLYEASTWLPRGSGVQKPRELLRRLGLLTTTPATLPQTLTTIIDTLQRLRAASATGSASPGIRAGAGAGLGPGLGASSGPGAALWGGRGVRSEPPQPVPQPPTIAPEPLMLSPLRELPYLFALAAPNAADRLLQSPDSPGRPGPHDPRAAYQQARQFQGQQMLQASRMGKALQSSYADTYLGFQSSDEVLHDTKAVGLWDRLVGRLCARLAWKRICLTLSFLDGQLSFSEGAQSRALWATDTALHTPEGRSELTYQVCTRHLIMVCMQLKDPEGPPSAAASAAAPQPSGTYDMLYWSQAGARQYALDWQASILYELQGICEQADALKSSATQGLFDKVLQALPVEAAKAFAQRLLLRLVCLLTGSATLHGFHQGRPPLWLQAEGRNQGGSLAQSAQAQGQGWPQDSGFRQPQAGVWAEAEPPGGSGRVLAAEVAAYRVGQVLIALLKRVPKIAMLVEAPLSEELHHLLRTPEARAQLAARSCNAVLSRATLDALDVVLGALREAAAAFPQAQRSSSGALLAGGAVMSVPHLSNKGALSMHQMPRLET